jgi:L-amino acid N-acyltransferase YncA
LWRWRNDALTRVNSFISDPISMVEHGVWMADRLRDPARCRLYIAEVDANVPVGSARIDTEFENAPAEVSVTVAPECRGHGYGRMITGLVVDELRRLGIKQADAKVRGFNVASIKMFLANGFVPTASVVRMEWR